MAITALNDYAIGDVNFNTMMETLDKTFKGKNLITLSAYDTTAAPDVKVGSVFENNGSLFIVDTSDITPTGYAGIANSTTFYLVYDESATAFIYSSTAPTWSDILQGWYVANDRYFFSMYKDSGGTLYGSKQLLKKQGELYTKVIDAGNWNMDTTSQKIVPHLLDYTKITSVQGMVAANDGVRRYKTGYKNGTGTADTVELWIGYIDTTDIRIVRTTTGIFDAATFNDAPYKLEVTYEI